jgi:hypothetical protein
MWLQVKIKKMFAGFFRQTLKLSDRDRIRNKLIEEATLADAMAGFLLHGYYRGHQAIISIEIDGLSCETRILVRANEPLMEYLCNWICAEKMKKEARLDEFDRGGEEYERDRLKWLEETKRLQQTTALELKRRDQAKNGGDFNSEGGASDDIAAYKAAGVELTEAQKEYIRAVENLRP